MTSLSDAAKKLIDEYHDAAHTPHGANSARCNHARQALWDYLSTTEARSEYWHQKAVANQELAEALREQVHLLRTTPAPTCDRAEVMRLRETEKRLRAELAHWQSRAASGSIKITGPRDAEGFAKLAAQLRETMVVAFVAPGETRDEAVHW
jgi:hypothetical protein